MGLRKDIWRPAIVEAPIKGVLRSGSIGCTQIHWLPPMEGFCFLADPFGIWREGLLYVFVERYDYRVRIGTIEVLVYDTDYELVGRQPALAEPWHLSYPFVFEADGEVWMLPEAHRSGRLTLYRAAVFPHRWEAAATIVLDHVAVDATPLFRDGIWWLFYTSASLEADKMQALHVAFADRLRGPWRAHPANPVLVDISGGRPGGTPVVIDGTLVLPVQDCSRTYGGGIRPLTIHQLTPDAFEATAGAPLQVPDGLAPFNEGMHTLSAAGPVTLIDVKRTELSARGLGIEIRRETAKITRRLIR